MKKIGFASDHAGYEYKQALIAYLRRKGYSVVDYGTHGTASVDYPDFAEIGALVKQHNNANVLVMPARFITLTMARLIVKTWLETEFEGGRHQRRIDKIPCA